MVKTLTICLVLLLICQQGYAQYSARPITPGATHDGPEDFTIASSARGDFYTHDIPADDLHLAREYGFSFWMRAQYSAPVPVNFGLIHGAWGGIAGMTENPSRTYPGGGVGDRALAMWYANGAHAPVQGRPAFHCSSYQMNNGNPWQDLTFTNREDFDWSWVFVYATYSYEANAARFFAYFSGSDTVNSLSWNNNNKRWPIPQLSFRLGPSHGGEHASLSTRYRNIQIFHGRQNMGYFIQDADRFLAVKDSKQFDLSRNTQNLVINTVVAGTIYHREVNNNELNPHFYENLDGVEEYAIYGWARWQYTPSKGAWHLLYRLSPYRQAEIGNMEKLQDRDLVCWVGAGYLHYSTSSFSYYGGHQQNLPQNQNYGDDLENWFFFYQGYSFSQKKVVAYTKFANSEGLLNWQDIWHMKADYYTLLLGKDQWHGSFSGDYKYVKVHFGPGAFRSEGFEDLYNEGLQPRQPVELQEVSDPGNLIESPQRNEPAYRFTVPEGELSSVDGDIAYAFWYRKNFFVPTRTNHGSDRTSYQGLAFVTETGNQDGALGSRLLAIWFAPQNTNNIINHVSTYDTNPANGNHWRNVNLPEYRDQDSYWNFVYFGYSRDQSKAFYYQFASRSGQAVTETWEGMQHRYPPPALHFMLGSTQFPSMGGHYYNPQFWYTGPSFLGTADQVDTFRTQRMTAPRLLLTPSFGRHELIGSSEYASLQAPNSERRNLWISEEPAGSEEFAIYGWFKWTPTSMQTWPNLFRVSMVGTADGSDLRNADQMGDRTLVVWANPNGNIYPATYQSGLAGADNWNWYTNKPYQDDLTEWFWIYFGHSNEHRKAYFYVKWQDREDSHTFEGAFTKLPYYFMITVGGEGAWHAGWNGPIRNVNFIWGPGAFRDRNFGDLQETEQQVYAENDVEEDNTWTNDPNEVSSLQGFQSPRDLQEVHVPASDLPNIEEYSFSLWFRQSYTDPSFIDLAQRRSGWTSVAGVTERDSFHDMAHMGGRALGLWLSPESQGKFLHPTTYAINTGNTNNPQNVPVEDTDWDGSWNWVYFGYSYTQRRATFYVKFGRSNSVRQQEWDAQHLDPLASLKFQLGAHSSSPHNSLHGRYYDVRFRYDNLAFKGSLENIQWYYQNSVAKPAAFTPIGRIGLTSGIIRRNQNDDVVAYQVPEEYNGARYFAIYGWAKWNQPHNIVDWYNLYRVTILPADLQNNCCGRLGSRTLALFYNAPGRFLHYTQYKYNGGDNANVHNNRPTNEANTWFWVYHAVNIEERKIIQHARFPSSGNNYNLILEDHLQFVPKQFEIFIGRDNYHKGWSGKLKGWHFEVGPDAWKTSDEDLQRLSNEPIGDPLNDIVIGGAGDNQLFPSSNQPEGDEGNGPVYSEDVDENYLPQARQVSGWTWAHWNFLAPRDFGRENRAAGQCYHINRIETGPGRKLEANLCFNEMLTPRIEFSEHSQDPVEVQTVDLPDEEDLESWNFVYLHHDDDQQKSIGAVKFKRTGELVVKEFGGKNWDLPTDSIRFRVSGDHHGARKFNGYLFDPQVTVSQQGGATTPEGIEEVMSRVTTDPDDMDPEGDNESDPSEDFIVDNDNNSIFQRPRRVRGEGEVDDDPNHNPNDRTPTRDLGNLSRKKSYSFFGYARWEGVPGINAQPNEWTLIYRFTQQRHQNLENNNKAGDRTLAAWVNRAGVVHIETYTVRGGYQQRITSQSVNLDLMNDWFYIYHGYSRKAKKVYFFMRFSDGTEIQHLEEGVRHQKSRDNFLYLGRDKFEYHNDWNGRFRGFQYAVGGNNAFAETPEEALAFAQRCEPPVVIEDNAEQDDGIRDDPENLVLIPQTDLPMDGEIEDHVDSGDQQPEDSGSSSSGDQGSQGELLPPEGDCVILYTECNFQGQSFQACDHIPQTNVITRSIYIPAGWVVTLFDDEFYQGRSSDHTESEVCLENGVPFSLLQSSLRKVEHSNSFGKAHLKRHNRQI